MLESDNGGFNGNGKCKRGSDIAKARSAFAGRDDGFVTPKSADQTPSGLSLGGALFSAVRGRSAEIRASVEPGPMTSMLPISKRKSSTITGGFCLFDTTSS
jgi:hypothetical protein